MYNALQMSMPNYENKENNYAYGQKRKNPVISFFSKNPMVSIGLGIGTYVMIFLLILFFDVAKEIALDLYVLGKHLINLAVENPVQATIVNIILFLILRKVYSFRKAPFFKKPYFPTVLFVAIIIFVQILAGILVVFSPR